jgi:hypothetical protein
MERQKVVSREYKVMLRPNRFSGEKNALLQASEAFWQDCSQCTAQIVVKATGAFKKGDDDRYIAFYDTAGHDLYKAKYILRQRWDVGDEKRNDVGTKEVTLKFRHQDRYIAQDRVMQVSTAHRARTKFEEDIKIPFVSVYSFSTTARRCQGVINDLRDIGRLFPDIQHRLGPVPKTPVRIVNGFTAREVVLTGAAFQIARTPKVEAQCALIVWYDDHGERNKPVVVEFSYRYGNKDEIYQGARIRRAFEIFERLQTKLSKWVDSSLPTKTAFVYGRTEAS